MTCKGTDTAARAVSISPALGVTPPSINPLHSSMRAPPPRSAATAEATESTQTSTRTAFMIGRLFARRQQLLKHIEIYIVVQKGRARRWHLSTFCLGYNRGILPPMRIRAGLCVALLLATIASAQTARPKPQAAPFPIPQFEDIAEKAGLTIPHISSPDKKYIVESMSGGVGLIDCDNDGKLDIITVNGSTVERYRKGGDPMITLYHQDADSHGNDLKFTDITKTAGLTRKGWGMGIAVADYDNDGLQDIYVTGFGGNALYHNLGNCKFEDVTDKAGVAGGGFSTGAAWADYDRDVLVDLFVSRYVHFDIDKLPTFGSDEKTCRFKGIRVQCGPWGMQGESDFLFHNRGDGTFEEVSKKAGVNDPDRYYGLGVEWGDYDNDGWPDLYVANDAGPNYLYHNNHNGTFTDVGMQTGTALSAEGDAEGSMGVDFGDYDHDGRLDIFVTNFMDQEDNLYRNLGATGFDEVSWKAGVATS